jgi:prolipoprotein diacylglyceryl transferase
MLAIIWDLAPGIIKVGNFELHWYSLFFAMAFFFGYKILTSIYKSEGKSEDNVDELSIYMFVAVLFGARIGHCLFYDWAYFSQHPLEIILPFRFEPEFEFTGFQGLASHGAAAGILLALYLYSRKHKDQSYMYVLDRMVIVIALAGACIRMGNLMNSEIIGKPYDGPTSFIFANPAEQKLKNDLGEDLIRDVSFQKTGKDTMIMSKYVSELDMTIHTKHIDSVDTFIKDAVWSSLFNWNEYGVYTMLPINIQGDGYEELNIKKVEKLPNGEMNITTTLYGIPRHPAQLYEAISCLLIFFFLYALYKKYGATLPEGRIFGWFCILIFGLRFLYEFLKENQVAFEDEMKLNMGQWLSIPLILIGIFALYQSYTKKNV